MAAPLEAVARIAAQDASLATVVTLRADGTPHAVLVNAGPMPHPLTGEPVVAFVTPPTLKVRHLRERPAVTLSWRAGWSWVSVDGTGELAGPDDPLPGLDPVALPGLLRGVFTAAGGRHDDWDEYDRVMAAERRLAVLVHPVRVYPSGD